ncbi:MAG TPA: FlgO family outer membrane protein [Chthoniobacterales bacterium]|jgi:TolB-like protein/class 3 adenylate cyclase/Flp pilus assembly protein TadD
MANTHAFEPPPLENEKACLTVVRADEANAPTAPNDRELKIEIGHVLFLDVVGYSKLLIHAQSELLQQLNEIVRATPQFRAANAAGKLLRLPTGDGMVLVFRDSPEAPLRCAIEIGEALRAHGGIELRMGIHSGPVNEVIDVDGRANVAGAGINIAQRVMDCGDAGHILLSKHVAEDLEHYVRWQPHLHPLGDYEAKHGAIISVVNFFTETAGNSAPPAKLAHSRVSGRSRRRRVDRPASRPSTSFMSLLLTGVSLLAVIWFFTHPPSRDSRGGAGSAAPTVPSLAAIPEKSIAVLPFENLSAAKETAYFADGIQDEILTDLAKIADLKVISRTSVMQYKTIRARNLREIGRQLGVAHVLEGSVEQFGNRIRVNAQLIDARTDAHLWAQVYDRDLKDIFAIQSEIAKAIADQLQAKLSPREKAAIRQASTTDLVAERLYRQALEESGLASNPDAKAPLLKTVVLLEEAIARDPHFIQAYGLLATSHLDLYWEGFDHTPARLALARTTIEQAEKIAPDAGSVHIVKGDYAYVAFRDYDTAQAELLIARKTMPNNAVIYIRSATIERRLGHWDASLRDFEKGVSLDPRNFRYLIETAFTYQVLRRFPEAAQTYTRALSVAPQDYFARTQLAEIEFFARADLPLWRAQIDRVLAEDPTSATTIANSLFNCALAERDRDALRRAIEAIRPDGLRDPYNNSLYSRPWFIGLAARALGDAAGAKAAFTKARAIEEKAVQAEPAYAAAWSRLGLIDAGLGRNNEAQREGLRACELLPVAKDALDGPSYITNLALIYAWTGEKDRALDQLARSAALPGGITYGELKKMPQWDPLRGDPRFEKIVASLEPAAPAGAKRAQ